MGAQEKKTGKGGAKGVLIGLVVATLLAVAAGGALGFVLGPRFGNKGKKPPVAARKEKTEKPPAAYAGGVVVRLRPLTVNLRAPFHSWARLEGALILKGKGMDKKGEEKLGMLVQQDTVAYLRTLSLKDLQGASNLAFLRDDLNARAKARSKGAVSEFIILSLVVE